MDSCVLCFSAAADQPVACIYNSFVWKNFNITRIIEKHFWWWHLQKSPSKRFTHICRYCWKSLSSFHAFYLKVEQKHKRFEADIWPALKGSIATKGGNEKFNENNQELNHQHSENASICKIVIANDNERIELTPYSKIIQDTNIEPKTDAKEKIFSVNGLQREVSREYDEYLAQTNYKFSCHLCNFLLMNFSELKSHFRQKHNVSGYAMCCNKKFYNRGPFCDHLRVHEDPDYFKCTICNRVLCHRRSYENHIKMHKRPTFDCDICGMSFSRKRDLEAHAPFHEESSNTLEVNPDNENVTSNVVQTIELPSQTLDDETTVGSYIATCESFAKIADTDDATNMLIGNAASEDFHFTDDLKNSGNYCKNNDKTKLLQSNVGEQFYLHILENTEQNISSVVKSETVDSPVFEEHLFNTNSSNSEETSPRKSKGTATMISKKCMTKSKKRSMLSSDHDEIKDFLSQGKCNVACDICGLSFSGFKEIKTHYRVEHKSVGYASCCNKKFINRVDFADHLEVHENPNYFKCTFCSRVLSHRASFKDHLARHKFVDKEGTKSQTEKHVHCHHADEDQSFQCTECNKVFASEYALMKHKAKMHPKKYKTTCDLCGKLFYNSSILRNHIESEHAAGSTTKVISCNICCKTFANKRVLYRHKKTTHSEELKQEHICPICYNISQNLNDHKKHMIRIHTNQHKYACNLCEKKFTKRLHLRDHLSTHTSMPMYACPHCPRKFRSRPNMYTHRKRMHPKEWQEAKNKNLSQKHMI